MRKVVLFIAMSLDGYIADKRGKVDWLRGEDSGTEDADTYSVFIRNVDTVIMGWNTYYQIVTELSPDEWVYGGLKGYVITHRKQPSEENIIFTSDDPCDLIGKLRQEQGKDIWVCGGADIIGNLMKNDMIDEYYISVIPIILGSGIRLFSEREEEIRLHLLRTQSCNGITDLVYTRRYTK